MFIVSTYELHGFHLVLQSPSHDSSRLILEGEKKANYEGEEEKKNNAALIQKLREDIRAIKEQKGRAGKVSYLSGSCRVALRLTKSYFYFWVLQNCGVWNVHMYIQLQIPAQAN